MNRNRKQRIVIFSILLAIVSLAVFTGSAFALITLEHTTYLEYANGSTVTLPAGTYFDVFYNGSQDLWYVNGYLYPSPTPIPTATPTPTITPAPTPTPIPTTEPFPTTVPTATPTYNPLTRPTQILNLYLRSDTYTACGVSGYGLDTDYTNTPLTIPITASSIKNVTYGFRVFLVTSATSITELTDGEPVAQIISTGNFTGQLSSSWSCPETITILGYQALKVDLYVSTDDGGTWTAQAAYITNVLMTNKIVASTWAFNLNIVMTQTTDTACAFSFGDTDNRSGINNVVIQTPLKSEIEMWRLNRGDYVGFEIGAYVDVIGSAFYVLLLLLFSSVLYFRYGHFGTVAFFFVLFGGVGGLAWIFVPAWAAAAVSAVVIIGTSFIVWRIIR